jgi:hypothetical protein
MIRIAFGNGAAAMYRANTFVANTGDSNTAHCEMRGSDTDDAAAMAC